MFSFAGRSSSLQGAVALAAHGDAIDVVLNDNGPRTRQRSRGRRSATPFAEARLATGPIAAGWPSWRLRARRPFAPITGAVHPGGLNAEGSGLFASCRSGARASPRRPGAHARALAYLASRETSEGWVQRGVARARRRRAIVSPKTEAAPHGVALQVQGVAPLALLVGPRAAGRRYTHARSATTGRCTSARTYVVFVGGPGNRRTTRDRGRPDGACVGPLADQGRMSCARLPGSRSYRSSRPPPRR